MVQARDGNLDDITLKSWLDRVQEDFVEKMAALREDPEEEEDEEGDEEMDVDGGNGGDESDGGNGGDESNGEDDEE